MMTLKPISERQINIAVVPKLTEKSMGIFAAKYIATQLYYPMIINPVIHLRS